MLGGHFHAATRLHNRAFPIKVVHLQLHEFHLGMVGEYAIKRLGAIVHGEADVADQAVLLGLLCEVPHPPIVEDLRALSTHVVQQVEIDVVGSQPLKRRGQIRLRRLLVGTCPGKTFRGDGVGLARVARDERFPEGLLGCAVVVDERGIEVVPAAGQVGIDHLLDMLDIDCGGVFRVGLRQAHAAEAELRHARKI